MKALPVGMALLMLVLSIIGIDITPYSQWTVMGSGPGGLDPTFGTGGKVRTDIQGDFDNARAVAIQADGKIVVAGSALNGPNIDFAVLRYNSNGTLDTSFDGDGRVVTPILSGDDFANAVAIQADGKIVAAGLSSSGGTDDFSVVRYNADGSLDTTFSTDGKATFDIIIGFSDIANAVAVQPDGKIVVAGFSFNGSDEDFTVIRLTDIGLLDPTFNVVGVSTFPIQNNNDAANSVAIQSDGKIVVAGYTETGNEKDFGVARLTSTGSLDASFDFDGRVASSVKVGDDIANSVAIQPDGKIVTAGFARDAGPDTDFAAVRYNPNGTLDTSFDTDGRVTATIQSPNDAGRSVALQPDGKIVIAGETDNGSNLDFGVVRLNTNGSLDLSFDLDGKAIIDFLNSSDQGYGVAIQPDGKIVVVGDSDVEIGLVRLGTGTGGQTRYVATGGSDAANDCLFAGSPCLTIGHAISVAIAGDTLSIAVGTYTELGLIVDKDLTFTGAGAATTNVQASALPNTAANRVFTINSGVTASMSDLTIRNGKAPSGLNGSDCTSFPCLPGSSGGIGEAGGGILNGGTLTLTNMVISGNRAGKGGTAGNIGCPVGSCSNIGGEGGMGGGVYTTGSLIVTSSTIANNHAGEPGNAAMTVGCGSCTSNPGDTGNGGGLAGATVSVDSSLFMGNSADDGGAILQGGAEITITKTTFTQNSASNSGAAINCNSTIPLFDCSISDSAIYDNFTSGTQGGTVALFGLATKNITNTTITGNDSLGDAGGINANSGIVNITFVTISDNIADANNSTTGDGGGIRVEVATVNLKNSIVADNSDDGGEAPQISGVITSLGYNHVESTRGGTFTPTTGDAIGSEDGLAPLANNGGPTQTQGLYASSQAINRIPNGTNDCGIAPFNVDQRGVARPANKSCDKGAFEGNLGTAPQEIDVQGGSPNPISIPDGDTTPSIADGTDFGSTSPTAGTVVHTFTIHNFGTSDLVVSNPIITGTNPLDFSVTASPTSPVAPGGTTTFQITFDPNLAGLRKAIVNIINNDLNENPYDFPIQGMGAAAPTMQFSSSTYSGPESRTATVTVTRTGDTNVTSTVDYATSNATAVGGASCGVGGADYISTSGTLTFNPSDTSMTFPVTLCSDSLAESPAETLSVTLSNATGGTLGSQSTSTATISDAATQFTNNAQINVTDGSPGAPYPSTINVTGLSGSILGVRFTLFNVTVPRPQELSVLLVDPSGTRSFVVMQGVGGLTPMSGTTITLEDSAASFMPMSTPIAPGQNYKPTNCLGGTGFFPPSAPAPPYGNPSCTGTPPGDTFAGKFSGVGPNGNWSLYTFDALDPDGALEPFGSSSFIGGWGIQFLVPTAASVSISGRVTRPDGAGIGNAILVLIGGHLSQPLMARTNPFGYYRIDDVEAGETYVLAIRSKRYNFTPSSRVINLLDEAAGVDFVAGSP